jgi:sensor histidine kinase YesM
LKVEEAIEPGLSDALPPFSLQPLVENAVQHGLQSSPETGCLRLVVRRVGEWLNMSISDEGQGVPSRDVERVFFAVGPRVHALSLLRRRLKRLFGHSFRLEIESEVGRGTKGDHAPSETIQQCGKKSLEAVSSDSGRLASR